MKSILDTLPPETIETLISWCEDDHYKEVKKRCAEPVAEGGLNLVISESTLCRLFTTHGIADSKEARADYTKTLQLDPNASLLDAAQGQLELRLLELSSRPNPSVAELRLISQILTRLRALQLSERRVVVAEKRETRQAAAAEQRSTNPKHDDEPERISQEELAARVRTLLGAELASGWPEDDGQPENKEPQPSPTPSAPPQERLVSIAEMQHRVRVLLGKEAPNEIDARLQREDEEWQRRQRRHQR